MRYHKHDLTFSNKHEVKVIKFEEFSVDIQTLIDKFNDQIDWDDMYNESESKRRFSIGSFCYVLYNDDNPIGIVWFHPKDDTVFLYNLFISKVGRPKRESVGINVMFLETVFNDLHLSTYRNCVSYIDEWNISSYMTAVGLPGHKEIDHKEFNRLTDGMPLINL